MAFRSRKQILARKIKEISSTMTDKTFFTMPLVREELEALGKAITKKYSHRAISCKIIYDVNDPMTAATDGKKVFINADNKSLIHPLPNRSYKFFAVKGFFAHELGHVLYTDFDVLKKFNDEMQKGQWYPCEPFKSNIDFTDNLNEINDFIRTSKEHGLAVAMVAKSIDNTVEDGFIEESYLNNQYGSLREGLMFLRDIHLSSIPTLDKMIENMSLPKEDPDYKSEFSVVMQLILSYSKFGEINYEDESLFDCESMEWLKKCIPDIDNAIMSTDAKERKKYINNIVVVLWPLFKDYVESLKEQLEMEGKLSELLKELAKSLGGLKGSSDELEEASGTSMTKIKKSSSSDSRKETKEKLGMSKSPSKEEGEEDSSSSTEKKEEEEKGEDSSSSTEEKEDEKESESGSKSMEDTSDDTDSESDGEIPPVTEEEGGRIHCEEFEGTVSDSEERSLEKDDEYEGSGYDPAKDMESLIKKMSEEIAEEALIEEETKALNSEAKKVPFSKNHTGIKIQVHRIKKVTEKMKENYKKSSVELLKVSNKLKRLISQKLKDKKLGGIEHNKYFGKKFEANKVYKGDGRYFASKKLPNERPGIAIAVLIDESGSMSYGTRVTSARAAAIVLHDFCTTLDIPIPIALYGHSCDISMSGINLDMFCYADFDNVVKDDKYRIMDITFRHNNRDGAALEFLSYKLSQRPEESKFLIVISDGQPAASYYRGRAAIEDMQGILTKYRKQKIEYFAAAIGSDQEAIKSIYGKESFMDITDLNKLPEILTKLVIKKIKF